MKNILLILLFACSLTTIAQVPQGKKTKQNTTATPLNTTSEPKRDTFTDTPLPTAPKNNNASAQPQPAPAKTAARTGNGSNSGSTRGKGNGKTKTTSAPTTPHSSVAEIPIFFDESTMTLHYGEKSVKMVLVKGGRFIMGQPQEDKTAYRPVDDFYPAHLVCLSDYYISESCVPEALYQAVIGSPNSFKNSQKKDCNNFLLQLNQKTSLEFRMPTEAEWEFAMRGGVQSKGYKYIGTDYTDEITNNSKNEIGISDYNHEMERIEYGVYVYDFSHTMNPYLMYNCSSGFEGGTSSYRYCFSLSRRKTLFSNDTEYQGVPFRIVLHTKSERYREEQLTQIFNLHEEQKVDLGLSVYWSGYNLCKADGSLLSFRTDYWTKKRPGKKYGYKRSAPFMKKVGIFDNNGQIKSIYDPASKEWGSKWRIPTEKEFKELQEECTWVLLEYKGNMGFYITGPNGNSIFLPNNEWGTYLTANDKSFLARIIGNRNYNYSERKYGTVQYSIGIQDGFASSAARSYYSFSYIRPVFDK